MHRHKGPENMHGIILGVVDKNIDILHYYKGHLVRLLDTFKLYWNFDGVNSFNPKLRIIDYVNSNNNINVIIIVYNYIMFTIVL